MFSGSTIGLKTCKRCVPAALLRGRGLKRAGNSFIYVNVTTRAATSSEKHFFAAEKRPRSRNSTVTLASKLAWAIFKFYKLLKHAKDPAAFLEELVSVGRCRKREFGFHLQSAGHASGPF